MNQTLARALARSAIAGAVLMACQRELGDLDGAFYDGDGRTLHCGVNLDSKANVSLESIDSGLDRARDRGEVVELYAHHPGVTVPIDKLVYVLAGAQDRGLQFFTYADFAHGRDVLPGLALSFDDTSVDAWVALRPLFAQYHARVTFFVSRYRNLSDEQHMGLQLLAADGHDIEPHSVQHLRAPDYVDNYGLDAYLRNELDPSIEVLRNDGFEVHAFAYPFGARTSELDHAIAKRVPVIRSVTFSYTGVQSPCPR
ncbi:MAG TPA: polysaccharide deacetylase family protein [Kofleriaceae bacterium]|nr:polysaccharide deacetylase family protein [Kofleriaceae bacterium]